jgi:hypothetical protein
MRPSFESYRLRVTGGGEILGGPDQGRTRLRQGDSRGTYDSRLRVESARCNAATIRRRTHGMVSEVIFTISRSQKPRRTSSAKRRGNRLTLSSHETRPK